MTTDPSAAGPIPVALHAAVAVVLGATTALLYANSLEVPFVFDDSQNIANNPLFRVPDWNVEAFYTAAFGSPSPRPVANLSFALNYALGGADVAGFHWVNIGIHWINGWLVYALALRVQRDAAVAAARPMAKILRRVVVALTAGALFVAHPIQTQSVTYIVQRMTTLSVLFSLLSLLLFLRAREAGGRQWPALAASILFWVLAMGSKQIAAPIPILALFYEWYFFRNLASGWLRRNAVWFASSLVTLAAFSLLYLHKLPFGYENRPFDMGERLMTQLRVLWFYLGLLVYPAPSRLNLTHDFSVSHSLLDPLTTLLALLGLIVLAGLAVFLARRERLISYCILWFFGTLAIESSVIALELVYEHRLYLPMVMLAIASSDWLFRLSPQRTAAASAVALALITAFGLATIARNEVWRDEVSLWNDVVSKSPRDHRAHNNFGDALVESGDLEGALKHFERSLELAPEYARGRHNTARMLQELGRFDEAVLQYRELVGRTPKDSLLWRDLASALEAADDLDAAVDAYTRSTREAPRYFDARFELGTLLARRGMATEAIEQLGRAIAIRPTHPRAHHLLGYLLAQRREYPQALRNLERAVELDPNLVPALTHLGMVHGLMGNWDLAEIHLREALRVDPGNPEASARLKQLERRRTQR